MTARIGGVAYAGLEIALAEGWKTYWRHPGDAGGVPPTLDWTGSINLAAASVLFPAPIRIVDAAGITVGYKRGVLLPVRLEAKDPTTPIALKLALEYGICREICIPAEAQLALAVPADSAAADPANATAIGTALARVPRPPSSRMPNDPKLVDMRLDRSTARPRLVFSVDAAGADPASVDAFAEGAEGAYLPQPARIGASAGGRVPFEIALNGPEELAELAGKTVRLTLVSGTGACEALWVLG